MSVRKQSLEELLKDEISGSLLRAASTSVTNASELPTVDELERVLNDLPIAVFVDSGPTECIAVNQAYVELCGVGVEGLATGTMPVIYENDSAEAMHLRRVKLWEQGLPVSTTKAVRIANGEKQWHLTSKVPITDSSGKVLRVIGTIINVTERVKSTLSLQKSEQQFRALVTNTADAIIGIDTEQCIQVWNKTAVQMFGYEQHEIIGKPITTLIPPRLASGHAAQVKQFTDGELARVPMLGRAVRAVRKDGSEFDIEVGIAKVQLGDEELSVATVRDVSDRERILEERQKSDNRFRALIQYNVDLIFVIDTENKITYVSPACEAITGYRPNEVTGYDLRTMIGQIHRDDRERVLSIVHKVRSEPHGHEAIIYRQRHIVGNYKTLEARLTNCFDVDGLNSLVINIRDISEKVAMEAELEARNDELTAVLSAFPDQLYRVRHDGYIMETLADNDHGLFAADKLVGHRLIDIIPGELGAKIAETYARVASSGERATVEYSAEDLDMTGDGVFEARLSPLSDGTVISAVRDISERVRMEKLLSFQALHDGLTGLPNRQLLASKLEEALAETYSTKSRVGILFLDLDGFKRINDGLGHAAGDELLIQVAARLESAVRPNDIVARIGGDEFIIMSDDLRNLAEAETVAEQVHGLLDSPIPIGDTEVVISASIGIALAGPEDCDAESLITNADAAMYLAKDRGRARAEVFDADMQDFLDRRIVLEAELRNALALDEIKVQFRAIIDASTGRISGAQATAHWVHTQHGVIHPSEFMDVAEEAGLTHQISEVTLAKALEEVTQWKRNSTKTPVLSVGLSLEHVTNPEFHTKTLKLLKSTGVDPRSLCIEITEASAVRVDKGVFLNLKALRDLGMKFAIDDYGSGFSSLSSLRSLPISCLKIDSSFIAGLETGRADPAIVRSTIDLAHEFGLWVVAKGVSTPEQLMELRSMGCDGMQGNLISEPLTPKAFAELLAKDGRW